MKASRYSITNSSSFSLIEIFVVVSLILILATTTISRFSFFNSFVIKNEVDKLFNTFSFLQQKAISSNLEQTLSFDLDENSYCYCFNNKKVVHKLSNLVKFGFLEGVCGPPSDPKKAIKQPITFKKDQQNKYIVSVFPDGKIEAGAVYFVDKDYKFMMALTCSISQLSYIRKYKYILNKWVAI